MKSDGISKQMNINVFVILECILYCNCIIFFSFLYVLYHLSFGHNRAHIMEFQIFDINNLYRNIHDIDMQLFFIAYLLTSHPVISAVRSSHRRNMKIITPQRIQDPIFLRLAPSETKVTV